MDTMPGAVSRVLCNKARAQHRLKDLLQQEAQSTLPRVKGKQAECSKIYLHKTFLHKHQVCERKLIRSQLFLLMEDKDVLFPHFSEECILLTSMPRSYEHQRMRLTQVLFTSLSQ